MQETSQEFCLSLLASNTEEKTNAQNGQQQFAFFLEKKLKKTLFIYVSFQFFFLLYPTSCLFILIINIQYTTKQETKESKKKHIFLLNCALLSFYFLFIFKKTSKHTHTHTKMPSVSTLVLFIYFFFFFQGSKYKSNIMFFFFFLKYTFFLWTCARLAKGTLLLSRIQI